MIKYLHSLGDEMIRKIGICDDESDIRIYLKSIIEKYYQNHEINYEIYLYEDAEKLVYSKDKHDILFLDMEMNDMNGIEVGQLIRKTDFDTNIIVVSGHDKYMKNAYHIHPFDYLIKPLKEVDLFNCLDELEQSLKYKYPQNFISLKTSEGNIQLNVDDIVYITYENRKTNIITNKEIIYSSINLRDLYPLLSSFDFIACHRAYIVNMRYVYRLKQNEIILSYKNISIPVSRLKYKEINDEFMRYLASDL